MVRHGSKCLLLCINFIRWYRLVEACDSLLEVERLIVVSSTSWTQPLVFLVLSQYHPYLAWILVKLLMVSILSPFSGCEVFNVEADASIADLKARTGAVSSCNLNNIPVESIPEPTSVTYFDYDDPFAMVDSFSGAPHISRLSLNAWVRCGPDTYVLECLGRGYIRIEPDPEGVGKFTIQKIGVKSSSKK